MNNKEKELIKENKLLKEANKRIIRDFNEANDQLHKIDQENEQLKGKKEVDQIFIKNLEKEIKQLKAALDHYLT